MKKILLSFVVLMTLVACGAKGTAESRYETAVKTLSEDNVTLRATISSIYDDAEVRITHDNMGEIVLGETITADVKVSKDGYVDVKVEVKDGQYTVTGLEEDFAGDVEAYKATVGAALYGDFRNLLDATTPTITETGTDDITASFELANAQDVLNIIATNELQAMDIAEVSGTGSLVFAKNGSLKSGTLYVEFTGSLEGFENPFSGSTKIEFSVVK